MNGERTKPLSIRVGFYVEQRQTGEKTAGRWRNWPLEAFPFRVEARHGPLRVRSSPLFAHHLSGKLVHPNKSGEQTDYYYSSQKRALDPEANLEGKRCVCQESSAE